MVFHMKRMNGRDIEVTGTFNHYGTYILRIESQLSGERHSGRGHGAAAIAPWGAVARCAIDEHPFACSDRLPQRRL